ncbi:MAG: hypothetical protein H0V29_02160 [Thermoleophilaceae bacterium]|nr:hypothetical protein [Thermoleophilaceae bacterium]
MTLSRVIPLPVHAAVELATGVALMASPFVFAFGPAGMISAIVLGAALVGLALTVADSGERGSLPLRAHHAYDFGLALSIGLGAVALGIAGDPIAFGVLAVVALVEVLLTTNTRYSPIRA